MRIQFVATNADGKEIDWVDPVEKIEVASSSFLVTNDVGSYFVDMEPGYKYELRNLSNDG